MTLRHKRVGVVLLTLAMLFIFACHKKASPPPPPPPSAPPPPPPPAAPTITLRVNPQAEGAARRTSAPRVHRHVRVLAIRAVVAQVVEVAIVDLGYERQPVAESAVFGHLPGHRHGTGRHCNRHGTRNRQCSASAAHAAASAAETARCEHRRTVPAEREGYLFRLRQVRHQTRSGLHTSRQCDLV